MDEEHINKTHVFLVLLQYMNLLFLFLHELKKNIDNGRKRKRTADADLPIVRKDGDRNGLLL